ncbi:hypothetical protein PHYSODRAFT_307092 [Phytophthora sojae]|uniref:Helicase-associated domain-containing protein n=1 Tax=Phytophthora sojae (strain P6497) TaxID=1094619 RepID=G5ACL4_PHYSP|nr:hypothetical protein PHYSODRAFT_307092 [Phytophthora sojae]EGZ07088.1 hypothetical protein PHYSODRAFT_307092 [Phytophthora sojae]|eukprot:XP_009537852.1 hypothetical protein PHYSODRAFT_307092 [Phytophthora sojae]
MDFAWDIVQYKWDRFVLPPLRRFYELKEHTGVPKYFRIPGGSPDWPEHLWDQYLGIKVDNIRRRGHFIEQVKADQEEMKRLNFDFGLALSGRKSREKVVPAHKTSPDMELGVIRNDRESKWRERIMPSLETCHRLNGHCQVPQAYVVPSHEDWPRLSWGLNLGTTVNRIRSLGGYSAQVARDKARLDELGFVWDTYEFEWSERIMPALETFRRLNGHCLVPRKYVVPSHEDWPRLSWDLDLGVIVNKIRHGSYFTQFTHSKARLEELDFVWNVLESEWRERILPALETFYRLHGHCRVPMAFNVPAETSWPEKWHGFKLGIVVRNIRRPI